MKKILSFMLLLALGFAFIGCGEPEDVNPSKVTVSVEKTEYVVGDKFSLTVKVEPENATNKKVTWKSSDNTVVSVDQNGSAEALKAGNVTITVAAEADATVKDEVKITVKAAEATDVKVSEIKLSADKAQLNVGEQLEVKAEVLPANATNKAYDLTTSDAAVLKVENGKVVAVAKGTAKVVATAKDGSGVKGELELTVVEGAATDVKVAEIKLSAENNYVILGQTLTIDAEVLPANAANKNLVWESSDAAVLTVEGGVVTPVALGTAVVTAKSNDGSNVSAELEIAVVEEAPVKSLTITTYKKALEVGTYWNFEYKYAYTEETEVVWSSSDEAIAIVSENGDVTAVSAGKVTITCKCPNDEELVDSFEITIFDKGMGLTDFEFVDVLETYYDLDSYKINVKVTPSTTSANNYDLKWTSSDEEVATVDNRGNLYCLMEGDVTITVIDDISGVEKTLDITIAKSPVLESFTINTRKITTEETLNLSITEFPQYANYEIVWEALTPEIATVDEKGVVKPLTEGQAKFKATDSISGISAECVVEIAKPFDANQPPESVTIVLSENKVYVGYKLPLKVEVAPAGVSTQVIWKLHSSSTDYASISEDGILTGIAAGTVRVQAISAVDESVKSKWVNIKVENVPELPPIPDMKGYKIIIMNADSALKDIDPFLDAYIQSDKSYKQKAWNEIEAEYKCDISVEKYPDVAPWGPQRINWIIDNATAGTTQCDFGVVSGAWINKFGAANAAVDTSEYFRKYGMNQIEPALKEITSYGDKYFGVSQGLNPSRTYVISGMYYNYGLIEKLGLESPAKLFNEGRWTYSGFKQWCIDAQKILSDGQYVIAGSPAHYWHGMVNAAGIKLADKTTMELNISHSVAFTALEVLRDLVEEGCYAHELEGGLSVEDKVTPFRDGNALFQPGEFWFLKSDNRLPADLFGENSTKYGYVPFPYPDTMKKEESRVNFSGESVIMMLAGRQYPAGITSEEVYRAVQDMYLRTVNYMNDDPRFNAEDQKKAIVGTKVDDDASLDAVIFYTGEKTLFDPMFDESFATYYSGDLYTAIVNTVTKGNDAAQEISSVYDSVLSAFLKAYSTN